MYRSKVPSLVGKKSAKENTFIAAPDVVKGTGLSARTVATWLDEKNEFANLNASVAKAFMDYFKTENLNDLVDIVERAAS